MYTEQEKQKLAKQYLPLVKKICNQHFEKFNRQVGYDEIEGYGWLGFALALNNYDSSRSSLSFQQYAAWSIRNSILNGTTECARTVKMSYYYQQQLKSQDISTINTFSINYNADGEAVNVDRNAEISEDPDFDIVANPMEELKKAVEDNFSNDMADIFFSAYGLFGHKEEKGKDIAKRYNVSGATITLRLKQVVKFIQSNKVLMELLRELIK